MVIIAIEAIIAIKATTVILAMKFLQALLVEQGLTVCRFSVYLCMYLCVCVR